MNKKCVFLYLFICLLVVGCLSLPEPDSKKQTLVVGMINLQVKGVTGSVSNTINGTNKMGIEISLQELTGYKIYTMLSGTEGLFYSTNIPQGTYGIIQLYLKVESSSGGASLTTSYAITTHRIEIVNGKVNNLGIITLDFVSDGGSGGKSTLNYNRDYEQVRTLFRQKYSSSNWNQKEWINNGINGANSGEYTQPVIQSSQSTQVPAPAVQPTPATTAQAPSPVAQSVPVASAQIPSPVVQQNVPIPQKFALVIGNGNYTGLSRLANPVNDANDMAVALQSLGFAVDKVLDGNLDQIENAVMRLKNRLSVSKNSYGFFFYAGHGVQSNGVNYLIPVGANIPTENSLRDRAVSVQWALNELNDAGNELNVVVLDACRDNPFSWARSGSRGLSVISNQPADSIIVYATSAGSTAADGTGRNGLFTSQLLKNITTPGIEISEIFRRTGADVRAASNGQQLPAVYSQFFGTAFLTR